MTPQEAQEAKKNKPNCEKCAEGTIPNSPLKHVWLHLTTPYEGNAVLLTFHDNRQITYSVKEYAAEPGSYIYELVQVA